MLEAVIDGAALRDVRVHRVSQRSGVMMLTDAENTRMVELGRQHDRLPWQRYVLRSAPIDMYVEVPDDQGGSVQHLPGRAAPRRNGGALGRERVRRAELVLGLLGRHEKGDQS